MRLPTARSPIIILGMHRSGTSMISLLLEQLGVFVGHELQQDHESTYFLDLNETIFERVHAVWDNPLPVPYFLANAQARRMTTDALADDLASSRIRGFLGTKNYLASRSLARFDRPWGWKDPRTVFTLPLWLDLFPTARLVYILRNGVDVAASLQVRELRELKRYQDRFPKRMTARTSRSRLEFAGYKGSARCLTLEGGFSLWEEYLAEAERNLNPASNPKLVFRYEDFLAEPKKHLAELAQFCELPAVPELTLDQATAQVSQDRARRFDSDPALAAFYEKVKTTPWMVRHGY
jgi:hypothetical protein